MDTPSFSKRSASCWRRLSCSVARRSSLSAATTMARLRRRMPSASAAARAMGPWLRSNSGMATDTPYSVLRPSLLFSRPTMKVGVG